MKEHDADGAARFQKDLRRTSEELSIDEVRADLRVMIRGRVDRYWRERELFEEVAQTAESRGAIDHGEAARFAADLRRTREELRSGPTADLGEVVGNAAAKYWEARERDDDTEVRQSDDDVVLIPQAVAMFSTAVQSFTNEPRGELAGDIAVISTQDAVRNWLLTGAGVFVLLLSLVAVYVNVNGVPAIATVGLPIHAITHDYSFRLLAIALLLVMIATTIMAFRVPAIRRWTPFTLGVLAAGVLAIIYVAAYDRVVHAPARQELNATVYHYLTQNQNEPLASSFSQANLIRCDVAPPSRLTELCATIDGVQGQLVAKLSPERADLMWQLGQRSLYPMTLRSATVERLQGKQLDLLVGDKQAMITLGHQYQPTELKPGQRIVVRELDPSRYELWFPTLAPGRDVEDALH